MKTHFFQTAPDDSPYLATMNHRLIEDEGRLNKMSVSELEARMRTWLTSGYEAIIAMSGEKPAGYALYRKDGGAFCIRQFFIERELRRHGFGRSLFSWLVENRFNGITVRLDVLVGNESGKLFWRSLGFEEYSVTMERK